MGIVASNKDRRKKRDMRLSVLALAAVTLGVLGCETPRWVSERFAPARTIDDLVQTKIDMPGVLFLLEGHGIGGYDALQLPPAWISYKRGSRKLDPETEKLFLTNLHQTLENLVREAGIAIADSPGNCVMEVRIGLLRVDIERSSFVETAGRLTLALEFRDSLSGQPLLRYATRNEIASQGRLGTRRYQIRRTFRRMLRDMNPAEPMRAAGLTNDARRPGCRGVLAERGRASAKRGAAVGP